MESMKLLQGNGDIEQCQNWQWTEVPAIIRNINDKETASIALIENLQREELTAIEEAVAYQKLIKITRTYPRSIGTTSRKRSIYRC